MSNVLHFSDLSAPMQDKLIHYIGSRYSKRDTINHTVSANWEFNAYVLKHPRD